MILIAGGEADPQLRLLVARAAALGLPHRAVLHREGGGLRLGWDLETDALTLDGEALAPTAAFVRQDVFRFLATKRPIDREDARAWKALLDGWLWAHPAVRLLNRGFAMRDAVSKPLALVWAREAGLAIPRTTIHSDKASAEAALADAPTIYKPVAGGDMARALEADALGRVSTPWLARPYIFQERLVPPETRVFRVGARLLAYRVEAPTLDYRETRDVTVTKAEVPDGIAAPLVALMDRLGLRWGAADFKTREATGEPVFLEVNSNPMFAAFDRAGEGDLTAAMLGWLAGSDDDA